jgi:Fic family protein
MPKQLPKNLLALVRTELSVLPDGGTIQELSDRLFGRISRRSLQRKLAEWVYAGQIRAEGLKRGRRYFLRVLEPEQIFVSEPDESSGDQVTENPWSSSPVAEDYVPLSTAGREVLEFIHRPIFDRPLVGYRRTFLDDYVPNETAYLPKSAVSHLHELGRPPQGGRPAGTFARDILDRLLIDLSWASSRLEGNTYSLLDTERLIHAGQEAIGKNAKETQMILNHKAAIELLVNSAEEIGVNRFTMCNLHSLLAENLLDHPQDAGRMRTIAVGVTGTTYIPTAIPQLIEEMFTQLLAKAAAIRDPFEQALFLMVQLPYLQPFIDVNKRTSRLAANIPLIKHNLVPLSFIGVPERAYTEGMMAVYEFNRVELIRDVFVWTYERSCQRYVTVRDSLPEPDPFRLKYRTTLRDVIGSIIKEGKKATLDVIREQARNLVLTDDLPRFCEVALQDIQGLHEGNIARYSLRPSEFSAWLHGVKNPETLLKAVRSGKSVGNPNASTNVSAKMRTKLRGKRRD